MIARFDRAAVVVAASACVVVAAVVASMSLESATVRGVLIGGALGVANLLVGAHFTNRSLAGEPGDALVHIAAGFGARFIVLVALLALFTFATGLGVSPAAFGFTFVAFVFVYFGIESAIALRFQRQEAA